MPILAIPNDDTVRPELVFPIVLSLSKEGQLVVRQAHHERQVPVRPELVEGHNKETQ
ncbi:MAG: hypothetical protein FD157_3211 [Rhodocyclaceae bacterium]|nr:MAG: hypothetical protein FD157_3211 [Rhodocyclaceae bacterium]TND00388.1 MAG: hypothetical protein FD118_3089 [Rhodocyclaceae bacterium]